MVTMLVVNGLLNWGLAPVLGFVTALAATVDLAGGVNSASLGEEFRFRELVLC